MQETERSSRSAYFRGYEEQYHLAEGDRAHTPDWDMSRGVPEAHRPGASGRSHRGYRARAKVGSMATPDMAPIGLTP